MEETIFVIVKDLSTSSKKTVELEKGSAVESLDNNGVAYIGGERVPVDRLLKEGDVVTFAPATKAEEIL